MKYLKVSRRCWNFAQRSETFFFNPVLLFNNSNTILMLILSIAIAAMVLVRVLPYVAGAWGSISRR
ncbi:MAG: hypothetical protein RIR11_1971 [Bacteroidota bacterium]|jgi:hypothetical protein